MLKIVRRVPGYVGAMQASSRIPLQTTKASRSVGARTTSKGSLAQAFYYAMDEPPGATQAAGGTPFIIGIAGGTASGKSSVCQKITEQLNVNKRFGRGVLSIPQDCFYKDLSPHQAQRIADYNFDHPDAFDFTEIQETLLALRRGQAVDIPIYDFVTSARCREVTRVTTTDVILFDGILAFYEPTVTALFDLRVFVDTDADTRLARRLRRDIVERGRDVMAVLDQYERTVKPSFDSYIMPTKKHADVIIPRGAENAVAIDLIWRTVQSRMQQRTPVPR